MYHLSRGLAVAMRSLYTNQAARGTLQRKLVEEREQVVRLDKEVEQERRAIRVIEGRVSCHVCSTQIRCMAVCLQEPSLYPCTDTLSL